MSRDDLKRLFEPLALRGNHIVVHTFPSAVDSIDTAVVVAEALIESVGATGTILVPTYTRETVCETPLAQRDALLRSRVTPYHIDLPVSRDLGVLPEAFRHLPGVLRSNHPTHSFAVWGRKCREVLSTHRDANPLGPLKKLNVLQGHVLLLGAGLDAVTAIHLAEEISAAPYLARRIALRINAGGYEERVVVENYPGCSAAFVKLEPLLDPAKVRSIELPNGSARKIPLRYLVNLASGLLEQEPGSFICEDAGCASCAGKREALARHGSI